MINENVLIKFYRKNNEFIILVQPSDIRALALYENSHQSEGKKLDS